MSSTQTATSVPGPAWSPGRDGGRSALLRRLKDLALHRGGYVVFIAMIIGFTIANPGDFATWANVQSVIELSVIPLLFAMAVTVVLIAGEFDLSFTNTAGVAAVVVAYLMSTGWSAWSAIIIALLVGLVAGAVNATVVVYQGVQSFIGTLAMGSVLMGIEVAIGKNGEIANGITNGFLSIAGSRPLFGLSYAAYIALGLVLIAVLVVRFSLLGHQWSAIGGNRDAAEFSGIPVRRRLALAFIAAAVLAAAGGILLVSQSGAYYANSTIGYLLSSYTAAFVGLAFNKKNRFSVGGTLLGTFLIVVLQDGLTITNQPVWATSVFNGVVLIVAVRMTFGRRLRA